MIESIKKQSNGWLVNGNKSVPNDERNSDCQEVLAYIEEGGIVEEEFTLEEIESMLVADMESALDAHVNSVARAKGYDDRITCTVRAGYVNPWQQEGIAFGQWMDSCYTYAYQVLADVKAGLRTTPTTDEFILELPEMIWPI